ncbi:glycoside hydrolase family 27 protein [Streptomyces sp. NPDC093707]|uniref:glycoside hydrolase family 27 protein n=1 Tax=Streptomyces sp. NPDC093707 TaxID=3154984 RepID=UPI00345077E5
MSHPSVSRIGRTLTTLTAVATCSAGLLSTTATADPARGAQPPSTYPNLAPTPPMGWNNWSYYQCDGLNEKVVLDNARALVRSGLAHKGYRTVTVDDCWMTKERSADGELVIDRTKFPHGMAYIGEQLHKMGLKFGIYEDVGKLTCGKNPGSYGHFAQDAKLYAAWKVDYLKADGCNVPVPQGQSKEQVFHDLYTQQSQALRATGRRIVFSISAPAYFQFSGDEVWHRVITWSGQLGNLWRGGADIALQQSSAPEKWKSISGNFRYNANLADLQRPGRWNDPDFLLVGDSGLPRDEMQSQMSLWAMMAAPLISSTDLGKLSPEALKILGNREVIAVDQDPLGVQGRIVQQDGDAAVLAKPLHNGDRALALFNGGNTARTLSVTAGAADLPKAKSYRLHDLVTGRSTRTTRTIVARDVPPHATVLYRVKAER